MASLCSTWPPASVWKTIFRRHYSSSSFSKWHQLYVDTCCVLLGLKTAFLVDCVAPDAKKLQLYLRDVAKSIHDGGSSKEPRFCQCISDCCVLTIGEDTVLANMRCLTQVWCIDHSSSKLQGHTLMPSKPVDKSPSTGSGPVYIDVTKGLHEPKFLEDEVQATLNGIFIHWLETIHSSFEEVVDKTELCLAPCRLNCANIPTLSSIREQIGSEDNASNVDSAHFGVEDVEWNVCTLFGQLLGYPVVYWFHTDRGYSLDMTELVCFSVHIRCKSDSTEISSLAFDEDHVLYSFSLPKCLHSARAVQGQVKAWFDTVSKRADDTGRDDYGEGFCSIFYAIYYMDIRSLTAAAVKRLSIPLKIITKKANIATTESKNKGELTHYA